MVDAQLTIGAVRVAGIAVISLMLAVGVVWWIDYWPGCNTVRVSESGIYYAPTHPMWGQVQNVAQCFDSIDEARASGFRAPLAGAGPPP